MYSLTYNAPRYHLSYFNIVVELTLLYHFQASAMHNKSNDAFHFIPILIHHVVDEMLILRCDGSYT